MTKSDNKIATIGTLVMVRPDSGPGSIRRQGEVAQIIAFEFDKLEVEFKDNQRLKYLNESLLILLPKETILEVLVAVCGLLNGDDCKSILMVCHHISALEFEKALAQSGTNNVTQLLCTFNRKPGIENL